MADLRARAILFDLDGVLVDSTECVVRTWRAWAAQHALDADALVAFSHGRPARETIAHFAPHLELQAELATLVASEATEARGVYPIPGAAALLATIPRAHWAIVTSGPRPIATFRVGVGGLPVPSVLITADDVTRGKPDPEGYLRAAERLGVPPGECIVIEDAPAGLAAARAAGMRCIGVTGTFDASHLGAATVLVNSVAELTVRAESGALRITLSDRAP
jgi:sugar-phosphatase